LAVLEAIDAIDKGVEAIVRLASLVANAQQDLDGEIGRFHAPFSSSMAPVGCKGEASR
jgi:hypothetical protein